jgi:hypothetical protein
VVVHGQQAAHAADPADTCRKILTPHVRAEQSGRPTADPHRRPARRSILFQATIHLPKFFQKHQARLARKRNQRLASS